MNYKNVEQLLSPSGCNYRKEWQTYIQSRKDIYSLIDGSNLDCNMVSEANWMLRNKYGSSEEMGLKIKPGDVVYLDYGQVYLNETGYQHFGLVMAICRKKALVIPMTSNPLQYERAYDAKDNPRGKKHLMRIGMIGTMNRPSVLFLNDMKFLNTARIIEVKGELSPQSQLFHEIQLRMVDIIFNK